MPESFAAHFAAPDDSEEEPLLPKNPKKTPKKTPKKSPKKSEEKQPRAGEDVTLKVPRKKKDASPKVPEKKEDGTTKVPKKKEESTVAPKGAKRPPRGEKSASAKAERKKPGWKPSYPSHACYSSEYDSEDFPTSPDSHY